MKVKCPDCGEVHEITTETEMIVCCYETLYCPEIGIGKKKEKSELQNFYFFKNQEFGLLDIMLKDNLKEKEADNNEQ